jgi:hypothetical protein
VPRSAQKGFAVGFWPIPESFWPDLSSSSLVSLIVWQFETFHTKSSSQKTIVHPTISDFNEIWYTASMDKYNNPIFFYFLHIGSRSVFTAL